MSNNSAHRFFVYPGITAHCCPLCADQAKKLRRGEKAKNSIFIPLDFVEQAQINMGQKIVKRVKCVGQNYFGTHHLDVICATVGRVEVA